MAAMVFNSILLGLTSFKSPLLRGIVPCVAAAFGCQFLAGAPSIFFGTERFYDLSGSLTYLAVGALSLYLPALRSRAAAQASGVPAPPLPGLVDMVKSVSSVGGAGGAGARDWRQVAATALVVIWATRLGSYLISRISLHGSDSRFDKMRDKPLRFSIAWFMQAVWVSMQMMPVLALNAVPAETVTATLTKTPALVYAGAALWAIGFTFETVADMQKSAWLKGKLNKTHDEQFLTKGLFGVCRYPNYFGEISLWTGIAAASAAILARTPVQFALGYSGGVAGVAATTAVCFISPAFISWLLLRISGIPLSEPKYDKKYGDNPDYQKWKRETPQLIPKLW